MILLKKCDSTNKDFLKLISELDKNLSYRNGNKQDFYTQFNHVDKIKNVIVAYDNGSPIACGAFKSLDDETVEIKRMFTSEECRGQGIGSKILSSLENWAKEYSFKYAILETGKAQVEAIHLYNKNGYSVIDNYGQYIGVDTSVCFRKVL